jgi:cytochrome d ubiquinol oxidase subunit II
MTTLGIIWYVLVFVLIGGYFVLDGFDLGIGVLSPFIAKNDEEKLTLQRIIGPVWDGNEVWLLTAGGALFAAFAPAYATTFSGFYLAIILVLMGLIVRAVSVEYASKDAKWRKLWNTLFFIGSLLPALLFGVAVGNVYAGIPMDANGDYCGVPLLGLVTPFTLLTGLLGLSFYITLGACWTALKIEPGEQLRERAKTVRSRFLVITLVLLVIVTIYALAIIQPTMDPSLGGLRIVIAVLLFAALIFALVKSKDDKADLVAFLSVALAALLLVALWAATLFPVLVPATAGDPFTLFYTPASGTDITIASAASEDLSLAWMLGIVGIGLPLVIIYHILVYRTFRGRIAVGETY